MENRIFPALLKLEGNLCSYIQHKATHPTNPLEKQKLKMESLEIVTVMTSEAHASNGHPYLYSGVK